MADLSPADYLHKRCDAGTPACFEVGRDKLLSSPESFMGAGFSTNDPLSVLLYACVTGEELTRPGSIAA